MASAAPGLDLAAAAAAAEDPPPLTPQSSKPNNTPLNPLQSAHASLSDHPIAPDQFDPKWETNNFEIWSYYAYYVGNNGLTLFNFAPTAYQNLLYQAAGDGQFLMFAGT
jgi:hypothetical protein